MLVSTLAPTRRTQVAAVTSSRAKRKAAAGLFIAFSAWLLWPMLFATHVEAFSARLQTMAIMLQRGQLVMDDTAYPLDIEYFYTTRGAIVHVLSWLMKLTHSTGDVNFRVLILLSFAIFVGSCVAFARKWTAEPGWVALVVIVLTPGLVEIAFFYADNLSSAAMVVLGLAVLGRRSLWWQWLLAGAALACGVLLRADALIAAPSVALIAFAQHDLNWRRVLKDWMVGLAGAAAIFTLWWRVTGVSLRHMLLIGKLYGAIHNSWGDRIAPYRVVILFLGPTLLLIPLGMCRRWRLTAAMWRLVMVLWPAIFYAIVMTRTVELRDYLLLGAPFVVLWGTLGLTEFLRMLRSGPGAARLIAQAALLVYVASLFAPPMLILHDGPRFVLGRIYSPPMWRRWQRNTQDAIQQLQAMDAATRPGTRLMVLTTLFQSDRFLHLALLEDGYTLMPLRAQENCGGIEIFRKDDRIIYHIRTENPYYLLSHRGLHMPAEYVRAYQINAGMECAAQAGVDQAAMVTWGRMWEGYIAETPEFLQSQSPLEVPFPRYGTPRIGKYKFLGVQRIIPLSAANVADLHQRARQVMHSFEAGNRGDWQAPRSYEEFHTQAQPLVWWSPRPETPVREKMESPAK